MTYTEQAAMAIVGPNVRAAAGPDWFAILDLVRAVVRQLMSGCAPTPQAGYDYLTETYPWWRPFAAGARRRAIRRAVERAGGSEADADKVIAALAAGKLNPALMRGLYDEARR